MQDANVIFATDKANDIVRLISSVIGQEGEQNGYYRSTLGSIPSEKPFLTTVPAAFAFSALQLFVVPNSCPFNLSEINLPILPPLATNGGPVAVLEPKDQMLSFTANLSDSTKAQQYVNKTSGLYLTYTVGQQIPFSVPATNITWANETISFQANFPYKEYVMDGFSHGALTTTNKSATADAVVDVALAGPAVLQVNNTLSS